MGTSYYIRSRGKVSGPFDGPTLTTLIRRGVVRRTDEASGDQLKWFSVADLSPLLADRTPKLAPAPTRSADAHTPSAPSSPPLMNLSAISIEVAKSRRNRWIVPTLLGSLAVVVAILFTAMAMIGQTATDKGSAPSNATAATLETPPPSAPEPAVGPTPVLSDSSFVSSPRDDRAMAAAVGFVVIGVQAMLPDGGTLTLGQPRVSGSCFSVTPTGYLVTNRHVAEALAEFKNSASQATLENDRGIQFGAHMWVFFNGQQFDPDVVYESQRSGSDLAVLKINATGQPFFRLAETADELRGSDVYAAGFPGIGMQPLGATELTAQLETAGNTDMEQDIKSFFKSRDFDYTLTKGTISRVVDDTGGERWIQHEAIIRHGNSGGPLIDDAAVVLGINTWMQHSETDVQTNMSIEISQLREELDSHVPGIIWAEPMSH